MSEGRIFTYCHHTGKTATVIELTCQTDFAAATSEFKEFGEQVAMHVAFSNPIYVERLLKEEFHFTEEGTVNDAVLNLSKVLGEELHIRRIAHFKFGAII